MTDPITDLLQQDHPETDGCYHDAVCSFESSLLSQSARASAIEGVFLLPRELPPPYSVLSTSLGQTEEADLLPGYNQALNDANISQHIFDFQRTTSHRILVIERNSTPTYRLQVDCRKPLALFSKKPAMTMTPEPAGPATATIDFDPSTTLPYRPRAILHLAPTDATAASQSISFEARNFRDWTAQRPDASPALLHWRLRRASANGEPEIELVEAVCEPRCAESTQRETVLARFRFSRLGMAAARGAVLGSLVVPVGGAAVAACGGRLEVLLGGFLIAVRNLRRMGYCLREGAGP
jgi:hypothetical protein